MKKKENLIEFELEKPYDLNPGLKFCQLKNHFSK
jgi:hypothetical protein